MKKTLLYRLFGAGKVPAAHRRSLEEEGVFLLEEGIGGSVTLMNFRATRARSFCSWKRSWFSGSLVLTRRSLAGFSFSKRILFAPLEQASKLQLAMRPAGTLDVRYEASDFSDAWSGAVECRFRTTRAREFLEGIDALGDGPGGPGTGAPANKRSSRASS